MVPLPCVVAVIGRTVLAAGDPNGVPCAIRRALAGVESDKLGRCFLALAVEMLPGLCFREDEPEDFSAAARDKGGCLLRRSL